MKTIKLPKPIHLQLLVALGLMFSIFAPLAAQTGGAGPRAHLVWLDDPAQVTLRDSRNNVVPADFGVQIEVGTTIQTRNSRVEIVLEPNGSVIKIAENTSFRIDSLQESGVRATNGGNAFFLTTGKMRLAAAQSPGSEYTIRTRTAVAGVRGTDFYRMYDPERGVDWLCVTEGLVEFGPADGGSGIFVSAGLFVDLNQGFRPAQPDEQWLRNNLTLEDLQRAVLPPRP